MSAAAGIPSSLAIDTRADQSVAFLTVEGVLGDHNSAALRNSIVNATADTPSAVIVNISGLKVPEEAAWAAFIGARWQIPHPDVPIVLVCSQRATREAISQSEVACFMPVYSTENAATKALARLTRRGVRHAHAQLPPDLSSLRESRRLVREWLTTWSQTTLLPVALVVVNVFVENVLEHTGSVPLMRVETEGTTATIAVSDDNERPAARLPSPTKGIDVSGLAIVDALSRAWGSTPTASGKTVWAVIGPENQL